MKTLNFYETQFGGIKPSTNIHNFNLPTLDNIKFGDGHIFGNNLDYVGIVPADKNLYTPIVPQTTVKPQTITIAGVVKSTNGDTLPGAAVSFIDDNNFSKGTETDFDGKFTLTVPKGKTVSVQYLGHDNNSFIASSGKVNVVLQENGFSTDEIIVKTQLTPTETIAEPTKKTNIPKPLVIAGGIAVAALGLMFLFPKKGSGKVGMAGVKKGSSKKRTVKVTV